MAETKSNQGRRERVDLGFGGLSASVGDHIGHFYQTREEWKEILVSYLSAGLEAGDKCIYFMSPNAPKREIEEGLGAAGFDVQAALASGQLMFGEGSDLERRQNALAGALAEIPASFPLLRSGGDMTWSETLMVWETHVDSVENPTAVFLCQYDLSTFLGTVVMDALKTHPLCIVSNVIHQNPYYMKPEAFLDELHRRGSTPLAH